MDDNPDLPDEERGLYAKYLVAKNPTDHPVELGGDREMRVSLGAVWQDENGHVSGVQILEIETKPGMFLAFDDPAAQDALYVYANSVKKKYPKLAADIKEQIYAAVERQQAFLAELDEIERQGRFHAGVDDGPSLKELVSRPDAVERYLEGYVTDDTQGITADQFTRDPDVIPIRTVHNKVQIDREGVFAKGVDAEKLFAADWEPLGEDVTDHTMFYGKKHEDGRICLYHSRLASWTFDGDKRCLRTGHPTLPGQ
jgi:hypothetical protein